MEYLAQEIAKRTLVEVSKRVRTGMSEYEIYVMCVEIMERENSDKWWYHGMPGMVTVGERTILSLSASNYIPSKTQLVKYNDIITIDVAPTIDNIWGDYARTIVVQDGVGCISLNEIKNLEYRKAIELEKNIHDELIEYVDLETTYHDVYDYFNKLIISEGYENLDFKSNLGHSVELDQKDRIYVEKNNFICIYEYGKPFTLEPHIRKNNDIFGVKSENIYEFENGKLRRV